MKMKGGLSEAAVKVVKDRKIVVRPEKSDRTTSDGWRILMTSVCQGNFGGATNLRRILSILRVSPQMTAMTKDESREERKK